MNCFLHFLIQEDTHIAIENGVLQNTMFLACNNPTSKGLKDNVGSLIFRLPAEIPLL